MPDTLVLEAREVGKTKLARASRAAGKVPGVLYGRGADPVAFEVEIPALREALSGEAGRHAVLKLQVPGRKGDTHAVLKDYQLDPVRDRLIHIDLLEISMSEKITSTTVQFDKNAIVFTYPEYGSRLEIVRVDSALEGSYFLRP